MVVLPDVIAGPIRKILTGSPSWIAVQKDIKEFDPQAMYLGINFGCHIFFLMTKYMAFGKQPL